MNLRQRDWCWLVVGVLGVLLCSGRATPDGLPGVDSHGDPLPPGAIARLGTVRFRHGSWERSFLFAPDGKTLLSAAPESLCWFDRPNGKLIRRIERDSGRLGAVAFAPGGRSFAWVGRRSLKENELGEVVIALWDFDTGQAIRTILCGDKSEPTHLFFTPDGKTLLTSGDSSRSNNNVRIFDVGSGDELLTYRISDLGIGAVALSPNGEVVAAADNQGEFLHLWSWQTPDKPRKLPTKMDGGIDFLTFSPDGRILLGANHFAGLTFWSLASGKLLHREVIGDGGCSVQRAIFSDDGRLLVAALSYSKLRREGRYGSRKSGIFVWEITKSSDSARTR